MSHSALFTKKSGSARQQAATESPEGSTRDTSAQICPDKNCGQRLHYYPESTQREGELICSAYFSGEHTESCNIGQAERAWQKQISTISAALTENSPLVLTLNMDLLEPDEIYGENSGQPNVPTIFVPVRTNVVSDALRAASPMPPISIQVDTIENFQEAYNLIVRKKAINRAVVHYARKNGEKYVIPLDDFVVREDSERMHRILETMMTATKDKRFDSTPNRYQTVVAHPIYYVFSSEPNTRRSGIGPSYSPTFLSYPQWIKGNKQSEIRRNPAHVRYAMRLPERLFGGSIFLCGKYKVHGIGFPFMGSASLVELKHFHHNCDTRIFCLSLTRPKTQDQFTCNHQEISQEIVPTKESIPNREDKINNEQKKHRLRLRRLVLR